MKRSGQGVLPVGNERALVFWKCPVSSHWRPAGSKNKSAFPEAHGFSLRSQGMKSSASAPPGTEDIWKFTLLRLEML